MLRATLGFLKEFHQVLVLRLRRLPVRFFLQQKCLDSRRHVASRKLLPPQGRLRAVGLARYVQIHRFDTLPVIVIHVMLIDKAKYILRPIDIEQAELGEVDALVAIIVNCVVYEAEVLDRHPHAAEFAAVYELFKTEVIVFVDVELSEGAAIAAKLFFNS